MRFSSAFDKARRRTGQAIAALLRTFERPMPEAPPPPAPAAGEAPPIGLALQGGGAHGAFTWGVLDRLLESGRFRIEAMSGASAGALNAVVAANGLLARGPDGAREDLERFWRAVGAKAAFTPYNPSFIDKIVSGWNQDGSHHQLGLDIATRLVSPYQFNPMGHNPLREIVAEVVDFELIRRNRRLKLYVAATDIRTGRARIFRTGQISPEILDATTALPTIHHAVRIDGLNYWDGGFSANPPLIPLAEHAGCRDILLVQIEPPQQEKVPVTGAEIRSTLTRLTMMAPLNRELDALRWIETLPLAGPRIPRLHRIDSGDALSPLGQFSKLNPEWALLQHLRDIGRERATAWLARKAAYVGERATFRP